METITEKYKLTSTAIDNVSYNLQDRMAALKFPSGTIQRYRIAIEDVLISMRDNFSEDRDFQIKISENKYVLKVTLYFEGERFNPLKKTGDNLASNFTDIIMSRIGEELTYQYRKGVNRVTLVLGKKHPDSWIFRKNYFTLGLPIALQTFLSAIVSCSDAIMLGFVSQVAFSAISLAAQVTMVFNNLLFCICTATLVLAARQWGKRDRDGARNVLGISVIYSFLVSLLFFALFLLEPDFLMRIFTSEQNLVQLGSEYFRIISFSLLMQGFSDLYIFFLRATGCEVKTTLRLSLSAPALNLILNTLLIFGIAGFPRLGLYGAALATLISRIVQFIMVLIQFYNSQNIRFSLKDYLSPDKSIWNTFHKLTIMDSIRKTLWITSVATGTAILTHLGRDVIAAVSITNLCSNLMSSILVGMASACGIFVSDQLGKGDRKQAMLQVRRGLHININIGFILGAGLLMAIPLILKIYGSYSPESLKLLNEFLIIYAIIFFGEAFGLTSAIGVFSAGGDVSYSLKLEVLVYWVTVIPAGFICSHICPSVWILFLVLKSGNLIRMPFAIHRIKSEKWMHRLKAR